MGGFTMNHDARCPECGKKLIESASTYKFSKKDSQIRVQITLTCPDGHVIKPSNNLRGPTQFFSGK